MKNDQGQGHGTNFNREIDLRLVNVLLNGRYIIPVLVTLFGAVATIYALLLAATYIGLPGSLVGAALGVIIVLLRFETRITAAIDTAKNLDYQKSPTKILSNVADRENLLTPEELDALREIGSDSYQ
tara:strand:- start:7548 stop:7928 length:381 start_codon:yes stop_codon:yes gene_type:complete